MSHHRIVTLGFAALLSACEPDAVRHCNDPIDLITGSTTLDVTVDRGAPDAPAMIGGNFRSFYECELGLGDVYVLSKAALYEVDQTTKIADLDDLQFAGGSLTIVADVDCGATGQSLGTVQLEGSGPANSVLEPYCGQKVWLTAFVRRADCDPVSAEWEIGSQPFILCPDD